LSVGEAAAVGIVVFWRTLSVCRPVMSNVFLYWGASDWWLCRRGRGVAIAIIIIIIIIIT
jgi:hypothetical protein